MRQKGIGGRKVVRKAQKDQAASYTTGGSRCSSEYHCPPGAKAGITLEPEGAQDPWF